MSILDKRYYHRKEGQNWVLREVDTNYVVAVVSQFQGEEVARCLAEAPRMIELIASTKQFLGQYDDMWATMTNMERIRAVQRAVNDLWEVMQAVDVVGASPGIELRTNPSG